MKADRCNLYVLQEGADPAAAQRASGFSDAPPAEAKPEVKAEIKAEAKPEYKEVEAPENPTGPVMSASGEMQEIVHIPSSATSHPPLPRRQHPRSSSQIYSKHAVIVSSVLQPWWAN